MISKIDATFYGQTFNLFNLLVYCADQTSYLKS